MEKQATAGASGKLRNKHYKKRQTFLRNREFYYMVIPAVVLQFIFHYIPMYGVTIAFKNVRLGQGYKGPWVGLQQFRRLFNAGQFWSTLKNTLGLNLWVLIVSVPVPIILALLLHLCTSKRLKKFSQTATYLPYLCSMVVVVSLLNVFCNGEFGLINLLRAKNGLPKIPFFGDAKYVYPLYIISAIWQSTGYNAIVYLAALTSVNENVLESARIDGASKWQQIWHIYLPMIKPTVATMLLLKIGHIMTLSSTDKILLMQTPLNLSTSETLGTYVYKMGIVNTQYSYSTAVGIFNQICNLIILLVANKISKKVAETSMF